MKNKTVYTKETYQKIEMYKEYSSDYLYWKGIIMATLMWTSARLVSSDNTKVVFWIITFFSAVVLPIGFFVYPLFKHHVSYKKSLKVNNGREFVNEIELDKSEIITRNNIGQKIIRKYEDVTKITENKHLIVIDSPQGQTIFILKSGFIDCASEEALDFLRSKCTKAKYKKKR